MSVLTGLKGQVLILKNIAVYRVVCWVVAALAVFLLFWFALPPLNLRSVEFWEFLLGVLVIVFIALVLTGKGIAVKKNTEPRVVEVGGNRVTLPQVPISGLRANKALKVLLCIAGGIVALMAIFWLIGAQFFNASRYQSLLVKTDGDFAEDIAELSMSQIPVVDRDTAVQLGARKLGEMSDLVSQFEISEEYYTQINYGEKPVRVTPLEYGDVIKWLNNQSKGIPAYLRLDMVTQETELIRLDEGIKYAPCEYFMRDLKRYLRFHYPTKIFDESYSFEIDENGTPYWIVSCITYRIGVWSGADVEGAILVNAVTGEHQYYPVEEVPSWVDRVYHADLIIEQLNLNGKYQNGFWNAYFGQRGVLMTTDGYNYIAVGDDVYLYTGMTSVAADQSNVGFVLVNMRTKETKFYTVPGATEKSAQRSAQGQVQDQGYTATFPLLLNVNDRPTYFMSLKDSAQMIKMYAFVDVEKYNIVGIGATVAEARENYAEAIGSEDGVETPSGEAVTGVISEIYAAVLDGNTQFYFRLENDETIYVAPIRLSEQLPFLKAGDTVNLEYTGEGNVRTVTAIQAG